MPIHPCVCPHFQGWKSVDSHKGNRLQCSDEDPSSGVPLKKMPGSPVKLKRHKFNMVHDASRFFIVFKASSGAYMVVFVFIPIIYLFIIVVFCLCKCICIHIYMIYVYIHRCYYVCNYFWWYAVVPWSPRSEPNFFFRLSQYQQKVIQHIEALPSSWAKVDLRTSCDLEIWVSQEAQFWTRFRHLKMLADVVCMWGPLGSILGTSGSILTSCCMLGPRWRELGDVLLHVGPTVAPCWPIFAKSDSSSPHLGRPRSQYPLCDPFCLCHRCFGYLKPSYLLIMKIKKSSSDPPTPSWEMPTSSLCCFLRLTLVFNSVFSDIIRKILVDLEGNKSWLNKLNKLFTKNVFGICHAPLGVGVVKARCDRGHISYQRWPGMVMCFWRKTCPGAAQSFIKIHEGQLRNNSLKQSSAWELMVWEYCHSRKQRDGPNPLNPALIALDFLQEE